MEQRLDWTAVAPGAFKAMLGLEGYLSTSGLEAKLKELVKIRASQINGCAFCLDMHTTDARKHGEQERRLHGLPAWRELSWYSERERAALAWTEALTGLSQSHVTEAEYQQARAVFSDKELVDLTVLIATINAWNRMGVGMAVQPPALTRD